MLPLGSIRTWREDDNWTPFTHDEQITLMTLWSIARSALILGANLPKVDAFTLSLLTNDEVIAVDQYSSDNREVMNRDGQIAWVADVPDSRDKYVALFNTAAVPATVRVDDAAMQGSWRVSDLWNHRDLGAVTAVSATLNPHGAALYRVHPKG